METFLWALAFFILSYTVNALTAKAPQGNTTKPATLDDFQFPQSAEGTPEMVIFGDVWTADWMVLSATNLRNEPIRAGGGKK